MAPKRKRTSTTASMPPSRTKRTTSTPKAGLPQTSGIQEPAKRRSSRITAASTQMIAPVANMGCAGGAALEAEHGDVTKGLRKGNLKSPLMRIPRNVRDLIYAHLLTAPSYAKDRNAQSGLTSETASATGTLDGPSDQGDVFRNGILPGSAHGYPFVDEAMGLLCASKQLHAEASEYFYSKNTFIIMPEHKSVQCFWHCGNDTCRKDIPCLVHLRNIKQIKHIAILVRNPYHFNDPSHDQGARCLQTNLNTIHRCLSEAVVKLDTLVVRYLSCVNGRVEDIRKKLDTIPQDGRKTPTIMLKLSGKSRKGVRVEPGPNRDYNVLFQNARVLDELKKMAGIAKSVAISGDISTSYIRELVDALVPDQPAPTLSLKRKSGQLQAVEQPVKRLGAQVPQKRKSAVEWNGRMQAERAGKLQQKRKRTTAAEGEALGSEQNDKLPQKRTKLSDKVASDLVTHESLQAPREVETASSAEPAGFTPQYGYEGQPTSIYHQMPNIGSYMDHQEYCHQYSQYMDDMMERMQQTPIYSSPELMQQMWGWNAGEFRSHDYYG